ncbi:MAG: tetratricopeptide repeat protein [Symploca sp. SIO3C6]|nr:tetratricopeptide repeat protein [Symploca sp. SIO3C6]
MNLDLGDLVGGRYKIIAQLGEGGFGQTFVAEDQHLPGKEHCVVKQLKLQSTDPITLQTARRMFETEAKILHKLGHHPRIPQLFAYFEENQEFYLVQELIAGDDLSKELTPGKQLSEHQVIALLQEILEILEFVHQQKVIHRDLNPRNLIRRKQDGKLILIDFGAVKQVSTQIIKQGQTKLTVAIGTPGYLPSEQANGNPKLSSDIYAVGMLGISALTGLYPSELPSNPETGEFSWHQQAQVSPNLARVLDKMVCYDFRERYQTASVALQAIKDLGNTTSATLTLPSVSYSQPSLSKPIISIPQLHNIFISIIVLGLGAAAVMGVVTFLKATNATDLYNRGETLLELRRYEDALEAYNQAVEIRPEYAQAWKGIGNTLFGLQRYEDALEAYDQAIELLPDYLEAWKDRGKALEQLQRYQQSLDAFDSAIRIAPADLEAWNERGNLQIKLKQYSAAIASFDEALELRPEYPRAWYGRGWALHNMGLYQEAVESYDQVLEYKPDSAHSWYQRGNALINMNKYEQAVESYQKAVQFQPNFYQAWYSLGISLNALRRYEEAVASFERVFKSKPEHYEAWNSKGWALHNLGQYEEAVVSFDQAVKLRPNSQQAWYNRGNALYRLARYQAAFESYQTALKHDPKHYQSWYSQGNALVNLQRYQEAINSYEQAIRYKPNYQQAQKALQNARISLEEVKEKLQPEPELEPEPEKRGLPGLPRLRLNFNRSR